MSPSTRYAQKQAKAKNCRRRKAHERLQRDHAQAQHAIEALEQDLQDFGLPDNLLKEIEGRLQRPQKLLGKIFGVMFPALFDCRPSAALARVRGWDKHLPSQMLSALPKRSCVTRLRCLGLEVVVPLWRPVQDHSPATRSRWQWTWVADDSVYKKYGQQFERVGTWWSGQDKRVRPGIDEILLVVVIGDGKLIVPGDFAIRRPAPKGPGGPCQDKRCWVQVMPPRAAAGRLRPAACRPASLWRSDAWRWFPVARGAHAYPGSARLGACGPPPNAGTSGSSGWVHTAGGKGRLNFLYSGILSSQNRAGYFTTTLLSPV